MPHIIDIMHSNIEEITFELITKCSIVIHNSKLFSYKVSRLNFIFYVMCKINKTKPTVQIIL